MAGFIILFILMAAGFTALSINIISIKSDMASSTAMFIEKNSKLQADLSLTQIRLGDLSNSLSAEQSMSSNVQQRVGNIANTVNTLEKLSKTDQELLQKYSKIYFLSENYIPSLLSNIDTQYLSDPTRNLQFHGNALPFLTKMLDDANNSGATLKIVSAYRSFGTQAGLKASYDLTYGSGANSFSADQGYSEHQLGTAVDLTTPTLKDLSISLDGTTAFTWMSNNAYRYGFILSYPKNNSYYQYEPWHWVRYQLRKQMLL